MVEKLKYIPERGDLVWLSFSPAKGHKQKGRRPGFSVQSLRESFFYRFRCGRCSTVKSS